MLRSFTAHPRLVAGAVVGTLTGALLPTGTGPARLLIGWNVGVWLYLASTWWLMARATHQRLRQVAVAQTESALAVMTAAVCAVVATLAAIVLELSGAHDSHGAAWPQIVLALLTLFGSWLLLATLFSLVYASHYYSDRGRRVGGLSFPGCQDDDPPTYGDFLYFSFTLAATSQTSDVAVTDRGLRHWVLAQAVLSFVFNTVLLALAINTAAGLF